MQEMYLELSMEHDFIVIGAGIIGLSTAVRLLEEGASVTLLDRQAIGREASWAGGGILSPLCPWDYPNTVTQLACYSMSLYPKWTAALSVNTGIEPEYHPTGLLILSPYDLEAAINWCSTYTMAFKQLPFSYPANLKSWHLSSNKAGRKQADKALHLPEIAQVRNPRLLRALHERIKQLGGNIIEYCEVQKLSITNQQVDTLLTSKGKLSASQYILAAGAWSRQVLGEFALNLKLKPIRGQMLLYKFPVAPMQSIVLQKDLYLIPRQDGHILIGSTTEDVGFDKRTTRTAKDDLLGWAKNLLPELDAMPLLRHWSGLRPATCNNTPIIGPHPCVKNLYINSGHFRYGVTMAPGSAEILLNELLRRAQPFDILPYQEGWDI